MAAFNFPNAPIEGQSYSAAPGLTYQFKGGVWVEYRAGASGGTGESAPPTLIQDAPPFAEAPGQFWYESDTGRLYIWYSDPDSAQWVQVI
jgi:hypothetical protein